MTELNLISLAEGPDVQVQGSFDEGNFDSLMADEVVMEWLESLEHEESPSTALG